MIASMGLALHNELFELAEAVPPLPSTVTRLAAIISDSDSELEDVTSVLREDPLLVASLLRESNSATSAPASAIATIDAAIMRLGMARVLAVATAAGAPAQTQTELTSYEMSSGQLWEHSIRSSYVAEAIYRMNRSLCGPEVVTASLLHDVGKMLLDQALDPVYFREARSCHLQTTDAERELVDVDHAEIGAILLELWDIPQSIVDTVRFHHKPENCESLMAHVVFIADFVTHDLFDSVPKHVQRNHGRYHQSLTVLGLDNNGVLDQAKKLLIDVGHMDEAAAGMT